MKLKLNKYWTEYLLKYPETGMGYQKVDIVLKSGQIIKNIVVLNAEHLILPEEYKNIGLEEIKSLNIQGNE
ncbi:MAG: hypothetical protein PHV77_00515 [Candidatus Omnitrophica bacterium]|jgi:hypothetical protein|nr:hypothetical protein [Candidatus Omnitrophota bacterium]